MLALQVQALSCFQASKKLQVLRCLLFSIRWDFVANFSPIFLSEVHFWMRRKRKTRIGKITNPNYYSHLSLNGLGLGTGGLRQRFSCLRE